MDDVVSLESLGVESDPGTAWHPRNDKAEARNEDGHLCDLTDDQMQEHRWKPEALEQPDATRPMAAEDSMYSPEDAV